MTEDITPEPLMRIANSHWIRKPLIVGVKLDIFSKIEKGNNTAEGIAKELNTKTDNIERLLNVFVSLKFLSKENSVYKNSLLAAKFLSKDNPAYYGDFILMTESLEDNWNKLEDVILGKEERNGNTKRDIFEKPIFTKAMHNNALAPANILSEKIDFSNYKNLLDLGGGSGAYSIVLTNKNKDLNAVVLELPKVCETANEYIEKLADKTRVKTQAGNYLEDEFPKSDVILMAQILHSNSLEECKLIIKKSYDTLPSGGMIIINEFIQNPDKSGPVMPVVFALEMLLNTKEGNSYTKEEISSWLEEAGFKDIQEIHLVEPHTVIIAKK
jgi:cyclopropane fatty-acyl-phospholipid synthase-like methyltransferase